MTFHPNLDSKAYPASMVANDYWSLYELRWSDPDSKFKKYPIDLHTGEVANKEEMLVSFTDAHSYLDANTVFLYRQVQGARPLGFIDIDNAILPDGTMTDLAQNLIKYFDSYAEYSVSNGIHILVWLDDVPPRCSKEVSLNIEFYWKLRPMTVTGNRVVLPDWTCPDDLEERTKHFNALHKARFPHAYEVGASVFDVSGNCTLEDDEILEKMFNERRGCGQKNVEIFNGNWQGYFPSPSEADHYILTKLSWYSGKDPVTIERLFSMSPLSKIRIRGTLENPRVYQRPKWEYSTYREVSIQAAINFTRGAYVGNPERNRMKRLFRRRGHLRTLPE